MVIRVDRHEGELKWGHRELAHVCRAAVTRGWQLVGLFLGELLSPHAMSHRLQTRGQGGQGSRPGLGISCVSRGGSRHQIQDGQVL